MLDKTLVWPLSSHDGKGQLLNTNADTIAQEDSPGPMQDLSIPAWFILLKRRRVLLMLTTTIPSSDA